MSCLKECQNLLEDHRVLIAQFPVLKDRFAPWAAKLEKLSKAVDLESLKGERALWQFSMEFRKIWLTAVQDHTVKSLKSPAHFHSPRRMGGEKYSFPYDRWGRPKSFEEGYGESLELAEGWQGTHFFFGNAMAALTTFMMQFKQMSAKKKVSLLGHQGYFEFHDLLRLMCGPDFSAHLSAHLDGFYQRIAQGEGDLILIEPVYANNDLSVFDEQSFFAAWDKRTNKGETIVLIDTSLVGDRFDLKTFMERFGDYSPAMVVQFLSAIKLHQIGLEFSSFGILSIFMAENSKYFSHRAAFEGSIKMIRRTMGNGATYDEYSAVEFPLLSGASILERHCDQVFENNANLAKRLEEVAGLGLIKRVNHPVLGTMTDRSHAVAPYVVLLLSEGSKADVTFLKRVLEKQSQKRGMLFQSGSSFGFRFHRFEVNDYHEEKEPSFRIAMGSFDGPTVELIGCLIEEIAEFDTFEELREAYSEIKHPDD
ncbi:MAG: hypothetical protein HWE30_00740 [Methylocystaceae bacterium]|nr:hypothetical protein [Methylocystaceae bacterium]